MTIIASFSVVYPIFCVFVLLLLFLMRPLWLVAKERHALIIMLSRAISSTLSYGIFNVIFLIFWNTIIKVKLSALVALAIYGADNLILNWLHVTSTLHTLTMAVNRGHCVLFPIHYMHFSNKKRIILQCVGTYALAVVLTYIINATDFAYTLELGTTNTNIVDLGICILCGICYSAIAVRMFLYKYTARSWMTNQQAAAEKDSLRITLCCFLTLFVNFCNSVINFDVIYNTLDKYFQPFSPVLYSFYYAFLAITPFIADEICLMALCKAFRQTIWAQCGAIWAWMRCRRQIRPKPPRNAGIQINRPHRNAGISRIVVGNHPRRVGAAARVNNFMGR